MSWQCDVREREQFAIYWWQIFHLSVELKKKDLISACFIGDTAKLDETDENMRITK